MRTVRLLAGLTVAALALVVVGATAAARGDSYVTFNSYRVDFGTCTDTGVSCTATIVETNVGTAVLDRTTSISGPFAVVDAQCAPQFGPFGPGVSCAYTVAVQYGTPPGVY